MKVILTIIFLVQCGRHRGFLEASVTSVSKATISRITYKVFEQMQDRVTGPLYESHQVSAVCPPRFRRCDRRQVRDAQVTGRAMMRRSASASTDGGTARIVGRHGPRGHKILRGLYNRTRDVFFLINRCRSTVRSAQREDEFTDGVSGLDKASPEQKDSVALETSSTTTGPARRRAR